MSNYAIYLSYNNAEEGFALPLMPESFEMKLKGNNQTEEVIGLGQVNQLKKPTLNEFSVKTELPREWRHYLSIASDQLLKPAEYIDMLSKWFRATKPVRFIMTGSAVPINMAVSIESLSYEEQATDEGTLSLELDFKRYIFHSVRRIVDSTVDGSVATSGTGDIGVLYTYTERICEREIPTSYTVVRGDNLWLIARKVYGDSGEKQIKALKQANANKVGRYDVLQAGDILTIPQIT